jgi:hypothetical protein
LRKVLESFEANEFDQALREFPLGTQKGSNHCIRYGIFDLRRMVLGAFGRKCRLLRDNEDCFGISTSESKVFMPDGAIELCNGRLFIKSEI